MGREGGMEEGRKERGGRERGKRKMGGRGWRKEEAGGKKGAREEGREGLTVYYNLPPISELTVVAPDGSKGERGVSHESVISSKWARDEDINRMIRYDHTPRMTLYPGNS